MAKETDGRRPSGSTGRNRNAFCSFCRKSHRDVGPLVEGPGDVYICGECIDLCQSILEQEQRRRGTTKRLFTRIPTPSDLNALNQLPSLVHVVISLPAWPQEYDAL